MINVYDIGNNWVNFDVEISNIYDAPMTAPQLVHCKTFFFIVNNQPTRPPINENTMVNREKPPAITVPTVLPTELALEVILMAVIVRNCSGVRILLSLSDNSWSAKTLSIISFGIFCFCIISVIAFSVAVDEFEELLVVVKNIIIPKRIPKIDGTRKI